MLNVLAIFILALYAGFLHWWIQNKFKARLLAMERDLQRISDVMTELADIQIKTHEKSSAIFEDLEERMMELSVPSHDSNLPLERRHQVLALARQGVALDDIAKRLKAPMGEAELILNLSRYGGEEIARSANKNEQVKPYAQV
jgi:hypothetical protein